MPQGPPSRTRSDGHRSVDEPTVDDGLRSVDEPTADDGHRSVDEPTERTAADGGVDLEREVDRLRKRLDRKDQRLQYVIDHYEGLLAEQRKRADSATREPGGVRGLLRRLLP